MEGVVMEFYYGTSWVWAIQYLPKVMISASVPFIKGRKSKFEINKPWMMDSGVGQLWKEGNGRLSVEEYANIIIQQNPPVAWSYDYPCEPSIRNKFGYTSLQAQDMTNRNTELLRDKYGLKNVHNVIQGWKLNEYLENIDKIRESGLMTERLGIGSICRRGETQKILRIIKEVYRTVPGWVKLHGFGIKTTLLKTEAKYYLASADSQSWSLEIYYSRLINNELDKNTINDKLPYLLNYINKIEKLIIEPNTHRLDQYGILGDV
jgi:hypothetical protein